MKILEMISSFFKRLLKKDEVKKIEESKINEIYNECSNQNQDNKKQDFINSIRVSVIEKIKNKKVETQICDGDGLGIKPKVKA